MPAGNVSQLVGDHALDLVGVLGPGEQAGMDVDDLAPGDEGVDRIVVDEDDSDILRLEAGGQDQRPRHIAKQRFRLGIAKDLLGESGPGHGGEAQQDEHGKADGELPSLPFHRPRLSHGPLLSLVA